MTDEDIIRKVKTGKTEVFGDIVERYQGPLFGYIRNMINQPSEEVEDLTEEVLIAAYVNINGFENGRKFSSWLYRIAHNKSIDYFKKRRLKTNQIEDKEELLPESDEFLEDVEIKGEMKKMVSMALKKLEIKYREIILLFYFEEKSYEEISDILRIPVNNVGVLLFRAKSKLKEVFKKMEYEKY